MGFYPKRAGTLRNMLALFVVLVLEISVFVAHLSAQQVDTAPGIQRITLETREEAIKCGKSGTECAVAPYRLCPAEIARRYTAWIATPFSRVASAVVESLKKNERLRPMTPGAANGWGVGIYVSPSEDDNTDSIERVVIRRAGETIEPITTTLAPVIFTSRGGGQKQLFKGFFAFPMEAFSPASDITIIFIGSTGQVTCSLDHRQLSALR